MVVVLLAGAFAGTINTVVGSGTLVTFPVLLALGLPPVEANATNTLGLVPGSVSGAVGYREELGGQRGRIVRLGIAAVLGGVLGAVLLLTLPGSAFEAIVPVLIALALVLVVFQPRLAAALARRRAEPRPHGGAGLVAGVFGTGVYGGYFGAAQGILLLAATGIAMPDEDLQRLNALKNVLAAMINGVAAVIFIFAAPIDWPVALLMAAGAAGGGQLGATIGRKLSPAVLRGVIVAVGIAAIVQLLT